ncbi:MAG: Hpt domain-containing protein, partial [Planctomycetota bacterium]|nr:Hpt domain-containing protein [Planctomycetota bacterium]
MAKDPYRFFRIEARELLESLTQGILDLEKGASSPELVARLLRGMHTLKGAARVVRQNAISDLAHRMEDLLGPFRDAAAPVPKDCIDGLLRLLDGISSALQNLDAPREPAKDAPAPA